MLFLLVLNLELCKPATATVIVTQQGTKRKEEKGRMKDEKNYSFSFYLVFLQMAFLKCFQLNEIFFNFYSAL